MIERCGEHTTFRSRNEESEIPISCLLFFIKILFFIKRNVHTVKLKTVLSFFHFFHFCGRDSSRRCPISLPFEAAKNRLITTSLGRNRSLQSIRGVKVGRATLVQWRELDYTAVDY